MKNDLDENTSSALPSSAVRLPRLNQRLRSGIPTDGLRAGKLEWRNGRVDFERSEFLLRELKPSDRGVLKALHEEWFPLEYGEDFYDSAVKGEFISFAICWRASLERGASGSGINRLFSFINSYTFAPSIHHPIIGVGVLSFDFAIHAEVNKNV